MRRCLFFALASRAEGLPLVIVEAMMNGKAVAATDVDGIPRIVSDGFTGLLVPSNDPHTLARAMDTLHRVEALRSRPEKNALERATQEYTWATIATKYLELYSE